MSKHNPQLLRFHGNTWLLVKLRLSFGSHRTHWCHMLPCSKLKRHTPRHLVANLTSTSCNPFSNTRRPFLPPHGSPHRFILSGPGKLIHASIRLNTSLSSNGSPKAAVLKGVQSLWHCLHCRFSASQQHPVPTFIVHVHSCRRRGFLRHNSHRGRPIFAPGGGREGSGPSGGTATRPIIP